MKKVLDCELSGNATDQFLSPLFQIVARHYAFQHQSTVLNQARDLRERRVGAFTQNSLGGLFDL